jgi:tetratricopeptide (TPR) repeat protein
MIRPEAFSHNCTMPNSRSSLRSVGAAALMVTVFVQLQAQVLVEDPWWNELATARALYDQGRYEEAEQSLASVVKWTKRPGLTGLQMADLLGGIGGLYFELGRFDEGKRHLERSLGLWDQQTATLEPGRLRTTNSLLALYTETKQFSRAQKLGEDTLSTLKAAPDSHPSERVHTLHNLATVYYFRDRYREAEYLFREAVAILEQHGWGEDAEAMYVLVSMASNLVRTGKPEEALESVQRARTIGEKLFGQDHVVLARALIVESAACRSLNRTAEAAVAVQKALAVIPDTLKPLLQAAWDEYGLVLRQWGRRQEAKAAARRAAEIRDGIGNTHTYTVDISGLKSDR